MQFTTEDAGDDIAIVRGDGRLNMVSAPTLRETVKRAIDSGRPRIVVDMSRVQFMDSSGLGALIACLKSARQADGDLKIVAPSSQVQMVLALSNVDQVLPPHASVAEAYGD
ncbi:anti-sigma factor antagonist [Humibacter sp. BT305]|uniref:Anti-sigma factor antagonist n=1 Tax=Cnuibacter physcomitrellae TaxID=1619308 RepID=A0A1X9LIQ5_9MICO|nr:STAS domain-containing protein [Cnuibacter physcomitrellae]ARJ05017.1 anti-anti-sigma factor [Cnuibacter physcomitrellae]AXH36332.1 anti-sigma factor antagonist [Humibacter sp. BT305]MCS5498824.1 STAS domain-containing protein [Cnuibacter physcomitrellae]GGI34761.1 anti-sigma factor antagonist [Cnuibacter physcomitrellae]